MKRIFFLIVFFLSFNLFAATVPQNYPPDIQRIYNNGKLRVALPALNFAPFFMQDANNQLTGFDVSLAENMGKALGLPVEFNREASSFNSLIDLLEKRKVDVVIANLSITLPRALRVSYSEPYLSLKQVLLVNRLRFQREQTSVQNFDEFLKDKIIAVQKESSYELWGKQNYPQSKIVGYPDMNAAVKDLYDEKIYALFSSEIKIAQLFNSNPKLAINLKKLTYGNKIDEVSIAMNWHDEFLRQWVNIYLGNIEHNGFKKTIFEKFIKGQL